MEKYSILIVAVIIVVFIALFIKIQKLLNDKKYLDLEAEVLRSLGFPNWEVAPYADEYVTVKSRKSLESYDDIRFFKENKEKLVQADTIIKQKAEVTKILERFLQHNQYSTHSQYSRLVVQIRHTLENASAFRIKVAYISSAGNYLGSRVLTLQQYDLDKFKQDPSLLMGKGEYSKMIREQQKEAISQKQREFYDKVNQVIDYANCYRDKIVIKDGINKLDNLVAQLFDRTVNSIKKVKSLDSEEWYLIESFIVRLGNDIVNIVEGNRKILDYYASENFRKVKETCETLMSHQREFNEYISEKVESVSKLFGTRVVRNETINEDEYNYLRPYKKTITPFTAEVSATVFASAENNPLEYVVKNFYPNKTMYPEQIQKLYLLVEELETLRDAKQIIENYKAEYQQYLGDVPEYIMQEDEAGFYSRLGFAQIDESVLTVEYKFVYTSGGGMAQRSFTVPMTEENIVKLIEMLENKLTKKEFAKEQRKLMTRNLREFIKIRDNYTCCTCGNSTHVEPNLLLEIDHIIPIAKGGYTEKDNLQTLCWKCNRSKGDKIIYPRAQ